MRKILFGLVLIIILVLDIVVIAKGITISNFDIWGIQTIIEENDLIDGANQNLSTLVSVKYPQELATLQEKTKTLEVTKKEYEDKAILIGNNSYYLQTEEYEIEFLWTKIGNHAKDNNVEIKIDVTNSQINDRYDLEFTVLGKYSDVTQFIYDIENDSKLGFKIEDFSMTSSSGTVEEGKSNSVQGTFNCKEIKIDVKSIDSSIKEQTDETLDSQVDETSSSSKTTETTNKSTTKRDTVVDTVE